MNSELTPDIAIVGGGIAGLWLLSRLRALGYNVLLIEGNRLGTGQSIHSQGIIHGSASFAVAGRGAETAAAKPAGEAPGEVWRRCLAGSGEVDLSQVKQLAVHQYLWVLPPVHRPGWFGWFRKPPQPQPASHALESAEYPAVFCHKRFRGHLYRLDEPVLDSASLLATLADRHREAILLNQGPAMLASDGAITLRAPERAALVIRPRFTVFTAGVGNTALGWAPIHIQHLHMVMVRSDKLPIDLYAHCLNDGLPAPRLIVTSHRDLSGRPVWYLGGQLATEEGIRRRSREQIREARRELARLLPWVDLSGAEFATLRTQRAGSRRHGTAAPAPGVYQTGKVIVAWPNRLTLVPLLVEKVLAVLERNGLQPTGAGPGPLALTDWPRPAVASYPWDDQDLVWSR